MTCSCSGQARLGPGYRTAGAPAVRPGAAVRPGMPCEHANPVGPVPANQEAGRDNRDPAAAGGHRAPPVPGILTASLAPDTPAAARPAVGPPVNGEGRARGAARSGSSARSCQVRAHIHCRPDAGPDHSTVVTGSVKTACGPYVGSNQASASCWLGRGRRDHDHTVRSNAEAESPAGAAKPAHRRPARAHLAPSRRGNAARRSPASTNAPEQPVLDVRNQPDNHLAAYRKADIARGATGESPPSVTEGQISGRPT